MKATRRYAAGLAAVVTTAAGLLAATGLGAGVAGASGFPAFVGPLHHITTLASTVPANGDVNPYGVAVVPVSTGHLGQGNTLVSNFNNKANVQGTGTTIVQITPHGHVSLFAKVSRHLRGCPGGVGLTTALTVLRSGWVIVGSLPTKGGNVSGSGCLIVLNRWGHVRETFAGRGINGPWDMTSADFGRAADLFVTNVLNGTVAAKGATVHRGTVVRILLVIPPGRLPFILQAGHDRVRFRRAPGPGGAGHRPDRGRPGPERHAVRGRHGGEPDRGHPATRCSGSATRVRGFTVSQGHALKGELGLVVAPGGDILTVNGGNGNLVEVSPFGMQVAVRALDVSGSPPGAGALFGLAVKPHHRAVYFVDDATNTFELLH